MSRLNWSTAGTSGSADLDAAPKLSQLDEVQALVACGQRTGVVSQAEVLEAMSALGPDDMEGEELYALLEQAEVELADELEPQLAGHGRTTEPAAGAPDDGALAPWTGRSF